MTAPKKPAAAKKPAAKRGPTKAASLKALGLTQEDLDAIKQLRSLREEVTHINISTPDFKDPQVRQDFVAEVQAKTEGIVPADTTTFYARNLRHSPVGYRLDRQQGTGKKRIDLKARGQRGDLVKLEKDDLNDANLIAQIEYGVVEIITAAEAKKAIEGQVTNAQTAIHPAMASLRNELGKPYAQDQIKIDAEYNSQGITVAHLDPAAAQGKMTDKEVARGDSLVRATGAPQVLGNPAIVSDGSPNAAAMQADAIARLKSLEGPEAGLGGVKVTVGETQRT